VGAWNAVEIEIGTDYTSASFGGELLHKSRNANQRPKMVGDTILLEVSMPICIMVRVLSVSAVETLGQSRWRNGPLHVCIYWQFQD
jgi:hypothetical protein